MVSSESFWCGTIRQACGTLLTKTNGSAVVA